jgi:hypothetical protein
MAPNVPMGKHTIPDSLNTRISDTNNEIFRIDYPEHLSDHKHQLQEKPKNEWWRKGNPKYKK